MRRSEAMLDAMAQRGKADLSARLRRLRLTALPVLQNAIGAGLAWWIANDLIGHERPFFAPIAALISLGVGLGQRLPRVVELVIGVALGVLIGDLLIAVIGTGTLQIALVVALAVVAAVLAGGGALLVGQAGSSAVLVATLIPPTEDQLLNFDRFIDASIGGVVGIVVSAVLLPINPVRTARDGIDPLLSTLADMVSDTADALENRDRSACVAVLERSRETQGTIDELNDNIEGAQEVSRIAPLRWHNRGELESYLDAAVPMDHAARNVRVLIRHAITVMQRGEPVPRGLPDAVRHIAAAVRSLQESLRLGKDPVGARREALEAARLATEALEQTGGFAGQVVVAQVRSLTIDVLRASGLSSDEVAEIMPDLPQGRVSYG